MLEIFLIIALSLGSYQKNRHDNIGICEGNNNKFCEAERKSLEFSIKKMNELEKSVPSDS